MKIKYFLMALLLSLFSLGAQAAGSPLNESFTNLIALSNNAIEVGKTGDAPAFVESTRTLLEALGEQNDKGSSIRLQRASSRIRKALKAGRADNLPKGIESLEQAIAVMQKE